MISMRFGCPVAASESRGASLLSNQTDLTPRFIRAWQHVSAVSAPRVPVQLIRCAYGREEFASRTSEGVSISSWRDK